MNHTTIQTKSEDFPTTDKYFL